jgi:hypothetical protein
MMKKHGFRQKCGQDYGYKCGKENVNANDNATVGGQMTIILKKVIHLLIGLTITSTMYYFIFINLIQHLRKIIQCSPESLLWLAFLIFMPICLFIGSTITGYGLSKIDNKKFINAIIFNPGLYISLTSIIPTVVNKVSILYPALFVETILWFGTSFVSIFIGYKLRKFREKRS